MSKAYMGFIVVFVCAGNLANFCPFLTDPLNGVATCSLGDDGIPSHKDTCSFKCNTGYELSGSDTRTCQSDASWSGSETICKRGEYHKCVVSNVRHGSELHVRG